MLRIYAIVSAVAALVGIALMGIVYGEYAVGVDYLVSALMAVAIFDATLFAVDRRLSGLFPETDVSAA